MDVLPLGIHLTLLIGPVVPIPAPLSLMESLAEVVVSTSDLGRSGFQISFHAGRSSMLSTDYSLLLTELLVPFSRVVVTLTMSAMPEVLIDGIITNVELQPGVGPGGSMLTVTGEDISVMMDLVEKAMPYPAMNSEMIVALLLLEYEQYGIIPEVIPALTDEIELPVERIPVQQTTDLKYIQYLGSQHGYVFYITPGPVPLTNTAYWGPPVRIGLPQPALTANMGSATNIEQLSFSMNGLAPTLVTGEVYDLELETIVPVDTLTGLREPPLATEPAIVTNFLHSRKQLLQPGGRDALLAYARAQSITDFSTDDVVVAQGTVDTVRYGSVLKARSLVGVRGVGYNYDGFYYVKRVTHTIAQNQYKQQFVLTREGTGSTTPVVMP